MLPEEDVYELQIVEVKHEKNKPQYKQPDVLKDEAVVICELLGTENPEFDDKPFKVWIWGLRDGQLTYTKNGVADTSNAGKVLQGLGFDRDTLAKATFQGIDWEALNGLYLRGAISHKPDGKNLACRPANLLPVKNPEHQKRNQSRKADIFAQATA